MRRRMSAAATRLGHLQRRLKHPGAQLREQSQRLDELEQRLVRAQKNLLLQRRSNLTLLEGRLRASSPLSRVVQLQLDVGHIQQRLKTTMQLRLQQAGERIVLLSQLLDSLSPLGTLRRGYAIVTDDEGKVVRDSTAVTVGSELNARLARGELRLTVTDTK